MFTKNQLEYLTRVQSIDDWHCSAFVDVLRQYHESFLDKYVNDARLEQKEFDELIAMLSRASHEDIFNLQMALNFFNMLPYRLFTPKAQEIL